MQRINKLPGRKARLAKLALLWVSRARRPLRVDELQEALATQYEDGSFEVGKYDEEAIVPVDVVLSICCGLLVVETRPIFAAPFTEKICRFIREF